MWSLQGKTDRVPPGSPAATLLHYVQRGFPGLPTTGQPGCLAPSTGRLFAGCVWTQISPGLCLPGTNARPCGSVKMICPCDHPGRAEAIQGHICAPCFGYCTTEAVEHTHTHTHTNFGKFRLGSDLENHRIREFLTCVMLFFHPRKFPTCY